MKPLSAYLLALARSVIAFCCLFWAGAALAQDAMKEIENSLVHIVVTAIPVIGDESKPRTEVARGTGFVVSDDGFVLTSYHLIKDIKGIKQGSLEIKASFGPVISSDNNRKPLEPVKSDVAFDLLLLKVDDDGSDFSPVKFARSSEVANLSSSDILMTKGFQRPDNPSKEWTVSDRTNGHIANKNGPAAHLWMVELTMNSGQSGSPIFLRNGHVVGIATADSLINKDSNFMIPAYFADSLLSHIRLGEMQVQIAELTERLNAIETDKVDASIARIGEAETSLTEIQSNFLWSAGITESGSLHNRQIYVEYRRLANKGPEIGSIILNIKPYAVGEEGDSITMGSPKLDFYNKPSDGSQPPNEYDPATRRGKFPIKRALQLVMEHFCETDDLKALQRLSVGVIPVLKDGQTLAKETIAVDFPFDTKECSNVLSPNG